MADLITLVCSKCKSRQTLERDFVQHMIDSKLHIYCPLGHAGDPDIKPTVKKSTAKKAVAKKPTRSRK